MFDQHYFLYQKLIRCLRPTSRAENSRHGAFYDVFFVLDLINKGLVVDRTYVANFRFFILTLLMKLNAKGVNYYNNGHLYGLIYEIGKCVIECCNEDIKVYLKEEMVKVYQFILLKFFNQPVQYTLSQLLLQ